MTLTTASSDAASSPPSVPQITQQAGAADGLSPATLKELVQLFKLLADETRLKIVDFLMQSEELNVRTLCGLLAQSQPAVSHHLALLKDAGLIECRRAGKNNFYRLVTRRCQAYLDSLFAVSDGQVRRVQVENAVLTYMHDARPSGSVDQR